MPDKYVHFEIKCKIPQRDFDKFVLHTTKEYLVMVICDEIRDQWQTALAGNEVLVTWSGRKQ